MLVRYRDLILYRTYADLKAESQRTYLGILWWVIEPVTSMAIYYFIFSVVLRRGTADFVPFLLIGIIMWQWFSASVIGGTRSIIQNQGLVRQTSVHKIIYPIVHLFSNGAKFCVSILLLLAFLWIYGFDIHIHYLALPLVLLAQVIIILGAMLPLSAVAPFLPDVSNVLTHVMRLGFYMSGVLYPPERIPERFRWILEYNPMATVIRSYREILMHDQWPTLWLNLIIATAVSACFALMGTFMIHRFDGIYAKRMGS